MSGWVPLHLDPHRPKPPGQSIPGYHRPAFPPGILAPAFPKSPPSAGDQGIFIFKQEELVKLVYFFFKWWKRKTKIYF
jgi:hypothetical protein